MSNPDSFRAKSTLRVGSQSYTIYSLTNLHDQSRIRKLPLSLRILLENLLRHEDGVSVKKADIETLLGWKATATPEREISFMPARVLLQDFTGVPCAVDLAVMRDAIVRMGGNPARINPLQPVDLVIDHSVQVDEFGTPGAFQFNAQKEFERNTERYAFLRWTQHAFHNFRVVPPDTGIVHQVNLEYFGKVVFTADRNGELLAYPDTLVGTDSHTTMINGLGILGWGVGGIEAEAAMLGQSISMLVPQVVGFRLSGTLKPGATATDLVLTVTQVLRKKGVVGKFVEFYGEGLRALSLADRATIANMAPEYGATMGYFPVDDESLKYLRFTGRSEDHVRLVEAYCKNQGLFHDPNSEEPDFSDTVQLDLSTVEPSLAGPRRPQDRIPLGMSKVSFRKSLIENLESRGKKIEKPSAERWIAEANQTMGIAPARSKPADILSPTPVRKNGSEFSIAHGHVVIAAITSCTNTSNPSVMIAAGLLARNAVARGLKAQPWVKTSLAPGSKVVTDYLQEAGLMRPLEQLGFNLVGYGCTTCIGNSGPLPEPISKAVQEHDLVVASVLSGNRNFEGRVNSAVRANYLASPPLVVAYSLAGTMDIDLQNEPIGTGSGGTPVYLKDIWPNPAEVEQTMQKCVKSSMFQKEYGEVFKGSEQWSKLPIPAGDKYVWDERSTYIKPAPFFDSLSVSPAPLENISGAKVLAVLGDSVTTDHISPAGSIPAKGPAGKYLIERGVDPKDFNSFGSRRGNHEVMMRGTFANIRLRNLMAPGTEGGVTIHPSSKEPMSIFDAAMKYQSDGTPLIVLAGKEYGSGSSRDWAAKGPRLLGVRAVLAESFERIHRSNLVGMGVLPLQFLPGENRETYSLNGFESYDIEGVANDLHPGKKIRVTARSTSGAKSFEVICRIDTPMEIEYYRNDGILPYVLRSLLTK